MHDASTIAVPQRGRTLARRLCRLPILDHVAAFDAVDGLGDAQVARERALPESSVSSAVRLAVALHAVAVAGVEQRSV